MKKNAFKVAGLLVSVVGFGISLLGDWITEKEQDIVIEEKVAEVMKKAQEEK